MKLDISKRISLVSLIIIVVVIFFSYLQFDSYKTNLKRYEELQESVQQSESIYIKSIFLEEIKYTNTIMDNKSEDIQDTLELAYGKNFYGLENDIENPSSDSKLTEVFDNELGNFYINKDSRNNKPFVLSTKNLIWERCFMYENTKDEYISIENLMKLQSNNELNSQAIKSIINMNDDQYIFWQTSGKKLVKEMDIDNLIDIYNEYGLEAMKDYELLVPTYITPSGDIFGNADTDGIGHITSNYKIIIVQRLNVYDILSDYNYELSCFTDQKELLTKNENDINHTTRGVSIMVSIFIILMVLFGSAYIQNRKIK